MTIADRIFASVGTESDDEALRKAASLRRLAIGATAAHAWVSFSRNEVTSLRSLLLVAAVILTTCLLGSFWSVTRTRAAWLAFAVCALRIVATWPHAYNHLVLETLLLAAVAGLRPDDAHEDRLLLQCCRWLAAIVLFWSGVQKVLHGCYFEGQFLALTAATNVSFATPLAWIAADEIERLRQLLPLRAGAGPFTFTSPALVLASNLVWISEIALGLALLQTSLRKPAALSALIVLVTIQIVAHELVFGFWMALLLALVAPARAFRLLEPAAWVALLLILVVAFALPGFWMN